MGVRAATTVIGVLTPSAEDSPWHPSHLIYPLCDVVKHRHRRVTNLFVCLADLLFSIQCRTNRVADKIVSKSFNCLTIRQSDWLWLAVFRTGQSDLPYSISSLRAKK